MIACTQQISEVQCMIHRWLITEREEVFALPGYLRWLSIIVRLYLSVHWGGTPGLWHKPQFCYGMSYISVAHFLMQSVPRNKHCQMVGLMNQSKYKWKQSWFNPHTIPTTAEGLRKTAQILRKEWDSKQAWNITTTTYLTTFLNIKWKFNIRRLK